MTSKLFFIFLALAACGGPAGGDPVDQAVTVARELRAKPGDAEQILQKHSLTPEQWEALMYDIASDPTQAAKYEAALAK